MHDLLSPKQVAQALRVSESSVKRWCDKGSIATIYTDGGHRRIRLADLAGFVRSRSLAIQDFPSIGLSSQTSSNADLQAARETLTKTLLEGDEARSHALVVELYLAKHDVSEICDLVIAKAFHDIGDRWACGQAEIYQERRGCKIAQRFLTRLMMMVAEPAGDAPLAIGCSTVGDIYSLGSTMVELVLRDCGWRASALGENIPLQSLAAAIKIHRPQLVWVSCSHLDDPDRFVEDYQKLHGEFAGQAGFVLGGRALDAALLGKLEFNAHCRSMTDLQSFARQYFNRVSV
jgi:excisionase family DNA binding protein